MASDVIAVAPLPGREVSAAYLNLHNNTGKRLTVHRVSSPDFTRVEMHESAIVDDVARMRKLESVTLEAGGSARFAPGGRHLMLIEPLLEMVPGKSVTLRFEYDNDGILVVTTPVHARM